MGRRTILSSWLRFHKLSIHVKTPLWQYIPMSLSLFVIACPSVPLLWSLSLLPTVWMETSFIISIMLSLVLSRMDYPYPLPPTSIVSFWKTRVCLPFPVRNPSIMPAPSSMLWVLADSLIIMTLFYPEESNCPFKLWFCRLWRYLWIVTAYWGRFFPEILFQRGSKAR